MTYGFTLNLYICTDNFLPQMANILFGNFYIDYHTFLCVNRTFILCLMSFNLDIWKSMILLAIVTHSTESHIPNLNDI